MTVTRAVSQRSGVWCYQGPGTQTHPTQPSLEDKQPEATQGSWGEKRRLSCVTVARRGVPALPQRPKTNSGPGKAAHGDFRPLVSKQK